MKQVLSMVLAVVIMVSLVGCVQNEPGVTTTQPAAESFPKVSGTFMQAWAFANYDQARMTEHLRYLKEVGIDLLIVQSTVDISAGVSRTYFVNSFDQSAKSPNYSNASEGFLEVVLAAAQSLDMQVYVGLTNDNLWWNKLFKDQQWLDNHVDISLQAAEMIHSGYKARYADTLAGWYFWPEYWNMDLDAEQTARGAKFLGDYRDGLYALDSSMPMLMSPYITANVDAEKTGRFWSDILTGATLYDGDIFCCQDSVGAGHITVDQLDAYFAAMKAAVSAKSGLKFWANNEDFTPDFKSADMGRFLEQLKITHRYADTHISFAFCHYRNPDMGKTQAYDAYKYYYENGTLAQGQVSKPDVTIETVNRGLYVEFEIGVDNSAGNVHSVVVTKDGQIVHTYVFESNDQTLACKYTDLNIDTPLCQRFYTVYSVDFNGNMSEEFMESVNVYTVGL